MKVVSFLLFLFIVALIWYYVWDEFVNTFKVDTSEEGIKVVVPTSKKPITVAGIKVPQVAITETPKEGITKKVKTIIV